MKLIDVLSGLIEQTAERMETLWGPRTSPKRFDGHLETVFSYRPYLKGTRKPRTWRDAEFRWGFQQEANDRDRYAFYASAWMGKTRPELREANRRWLAARTRQSAKNNFEYDHDGKEAWLQRRLDPKDLIRQGDIEGQADFLTRWIAAAFKDLGQPPA
jgi:hypothetical protein